MSIPSNRVIDRYRSTDPANPTRFGPGDLATPSRPPRLAAGVGDVM
jgi:hypothetical protein